MDSKKLWTCVRCGVPSCECIVDGATIVCGPHTGEWHCSTCLEEGQVRCSYCDTIIMERGTTDPLPVEVDDGSFLCLKCNTQLLEELDDFTDNYESYTEGPGSTPWYNHRLSSPTSQ